MSGIVLAAPDGAFEERVRRAFGDTLNGDLKAWGGDLRAVHAAETVEGIAALRPELVAIGPGLPFDEWAALALAFEHAHPEITVVLVAEPTPRLWEVALRAGVRDVISPTAEDDEVREAFERILETIQRRRANLLGEPEAGPLGQIVTVLGPKGGVGKTTVATNLAVGLAAAAPREVVVVDLDLRFGDVAHALRLTPERTIADAARARAERDAASLKAFLTPHSSGVYALCAPDSPAEADDMDADQVCRILRVLGESFRFVVVDTGSGLDEFTLAAGEAATDFVFVGVTDVPSVHSMRKELDALDRIGMTHQTRHLVLNRSDAQAGLDVDDIEETVGVEVSVAVPTSAQATLCINQGSPLLDSDDESPAVDALLALVSRFAEVPVDEAPRGLFSKRKVRSR